MGVKKKPVLDKYDIAILSALATNTRLTTVELAAKVHLSRTAVSRRITALRQSNVLNDSAQVLNYSALGFTVHAIVEIHAPSRAAEKLRTSLLLQPEVLSVGVVAGDGLLSVNVVALDMDHLHAFISSLQESGSTKTNIIFTEDKSKLTLLERIRILNERTGENLVRT